MRIIFSCSNLHHIVVILQKPRRRSTAARVARNTALVCTAVCTSVGKLLYVQQCVQVWGNTCMYNSVYRCGETLVCTMCTGAGKHLCVRQYVEAWGNICMYNSMYRCGEIFACTTVCTGVRKWFAHYLVMQHWLNVIVLDEQR